MPLLLRYECASTEAALAIAHEILALPPARWSVGSFERVIADRGDRVPFQMIDAKDGGMIEVTEWLKVWEAPGRAFLEIDLVRMGQAGC